MIVKSDAEVLYDHFESFLGQTEQRWHTRNNDGEALSVFEYIGQPDSAATTLLTFGLSSHQFRTRAPTAVTLRTELMICANSEFDAKALSALLFAVSFDALVEHLMPAEHGVLPGSGPVLGAGNPRFEHLYFARPGFFPVKFQRVENILIPIDVMQLIPISTREKELISAEGWEAFEDLVIAQGIDLLEFDQRDEVR